MKTRKTTEAKPAVKKTTDGPAIPCLALLCIFLFIVFRWPLKRKLQLLLLTHVQSKRLCQSEDIKNRVILSGDGTCRDKSFFNFLCNRCVNVRKSPVVDRSQFADERCGIHILDKGEIMTQTVKDVLCMKQRRRISRDGREISPQEALDNLLSKQPRLARYVSLHNVPRQQSLAGGVGGSQGLGAKALGLLFCQQALCLSGGMSNPCSSKQPTGQRFAGRACSVSSFFLSYRGDKIEIDPNRFYRLSVANLANAIPRTTAMK